MRFVLALMLAAAGNAHAALITVEPDDFAVGTVLTNAVPGVTLTIEGHPTEPVIVRDGTFAGGPTAGQNNSPTGTRVFGHNIPGPISPPSDFFFIWTTISSTAMPVLRADFDGLADFVTIDVFANDDDTFELKAFGFGDVLLDTFNTGEINGAAATMSITRASADIAYILASGVTEEGGGQLDHLRANVTLAAVPAPSPLAVLGVALLVLGLTRMH